MAFNFKLEQILTYRRNLEEQAQLNLAKETKTLDVLYAQLAQFRAERQVLINRFEELKKQAISGSDFSFFMEGIHFKENEIGAQIKKIEKQKRVVEKSRFVLFEKVKEKKIIEKLREKQARDYIKEADKKELKENDEKATMHYSRNMQLL